METGKVEYAPDSKSRFDSAIREGRTGDAIQIALQQNAEHQRLKDAVSETAKTWNATNHRDKLAVERALTELGDAVDALLDFEQKQETK